MNNSKITSKKIICWREIPPDVDIGLFRQLSNIWREIIIVCNNDFDVPRKQCAFKNDKLKNTRIVTLKSDEKAFEIIDENYKEDTLHIFYGIVGSNSKYIKYLIKKNPKVKFVIIAERPNIYGNIFEYIWRKVTRFGYYTLMAHIYNKNLLCFFPLGQKGVSEYKNYGWNKKVLFPIPYTLELVDKNKEANKVNKKMKFLYIGRFQFDTKGVDILIKAFNKLKNEYNYELDLVGGYGKDKDKTLKLMENNSKIKFLGLWKIKEVIENMKNYDIAIAPSRYDGWNLLPNQTIDAGIAAIVSDGTVSHEMIKKSNSGLVIKRNSVSSLVTALKFSIENPDVVNEWKNNAIKYRKKINNKLIAQYFTSAIIWSYSCKGKKPQAPWLV